MPSTLAWRASNADPGGKIRQPSAADMVSSFWAPARLDAIAAMAERCVENVLALLEGRDPGADHVLNPEVIGRK